MVKTCFINVSDFTHKGKNSINKFSLRCSFISLYTIFLVNVYIEKKNDAFYLLHKNTFVLY